LEGIFGNVFQSAFGKELYPSLESKAAHLLYFVVKNHQDKQGMVDLVILLLSGK
jgi:hypothetical protein